MAFFNDSTFCSGKNNPVGASSELLPNPTTVRANMAKGGAQKRADASAYLRRNASKYQCGVRAAKSERIRQHDVDFALL